ncbi:MAG: hypothetical protein FJ146_19370 [Deltaproteobacteria bacterium]|nr:hypothetical protein [Deltaproteobacteria bacterium]
MTQPAPRRRQQSPWQGLGQKLSYDLREIEVGGHKFMLRCLDDLEEALSTSLKLVAARDKSGSATSTAEFKPHFGVIWPSAVGLATHLAALFATNGVARATVELGCGLALPSLVAAAAGVPRVIATDRHPMVAEFLATNAAQNQLAGITYQNLDWRDITAHEAQVLGGQVELLIGSDLLYESWQPGYLATTVASLLAPGGAAILADPGRRYMDDFLSLCEAHGLICRQTAVREVQLDQQHSDVLIAEIGWS